MTIEDNQIAEITANICQAMLGINIEKTPSEAADPTSLDCSASVQIFGQQNAIIQVFVCEKAAQTLACSMFETKPGNASGGEIEDAVSEVTNMIGGNIKGIFNCDCQLSLPSFTRDNGGTQDQWAGREFVDFELGTGSMRVSCKVETNCPN